MKKICSIFLAVFLMVTMMTVSANAEEFDVELNPNLNYLILVNDEHEYRFGGEYDLELTRKNEAGEYLNLTHAPDVYGEDTLVENATYAAFVRLQGKLAEQGLLIQLYSGYWSEEIHTWLLETHKDDRSELLWKLADLGKSDHNTGLAIWVYIWDTWEDETFLWGAETQIRSETIPRFKLLHETLADYGFIDRFPLGKEEWTGTWSEPFEIRFVGSPEVAHAIMDNDLCLEEYLELNK